MDKSTPHPYKQDINTIKSVCVCGKGMLDHVHATSVVKITGIAKPTKQG